MLGKFSSFEQGIGEYKNTRMHSIALFVQDNFRVNSKLTLNLGVRWDPFTAYKDETNRTACYRPGVESQVYTNAPIGAAYPGDDRCPEGGYGADWLNIGPRLGFAYDPFGDGRTSLRAGYGVFFDRPNTIATNSAANQGPFGTVVTFPGDANNSMTTTYAGRTNPFPADPFNVPSRRRVRAAAPDVQLLRELRERDDADVARDRSSARSCRPGWCASPTPARAAASCRSASR